MAINRVEINTSIPVSLLSFRISRNPVVTKQPPVLVGGCLVTNSDMVFSISVLDYFMQIPAQSALPWAGSQLSEGSSTHFMPSGHGKPAIPPHICFGS